MPRRRLAVSFVAALVLSCAPGMAEVPGPASSAPSLVVVIVVDQLPERVLERLAPRFGPGGFRRLLEGGAWFVDAHYPQAATLTGVGHAMLATGALPAESGVPGNDWYDRVADRIVYCVEDRAHTWIGGKTPDEAGTSPRNLTAPTLGDALRIATERRGRVVALSLKDRASILLGGKLGEAYWYDGASGAFVSSTYYHENGALPEWIERFNAARRAARAFGAPWELLRPATEYAARDDRPYEKNLPGLGTTFPHVLGEGLAATDSAFTKLLIYTPVGHQLVLELAREAIDAAQLGRRGVTDILYLGLSANDYCGHLFGADSREYEDLTLRLDRQLASFFAELDALRGEGRWLLALTSDHGVGPGADAAAEAGLPVGRIDPQVLATTADAALDRRFGDADWVVKFLNPGVFLRETVVAAAGAPREEIERVAAEALATVPGVAATFTRGDLAAGRGGDTAVARSVRATFHPVRSPDVILVQEPHWYLYKDLEKYLGMHGSPWAYDTHVPVLLHGPGVRAGRFARRVSPADLVPTLAALIGCDAPAAATGPLLAEALATVSREPSGSVAVRTAALETTPGAAALTVVRLPALPPILGPGGRALTAPVTAPFAGAVPWREPRAVPLLDGGFSALARVAAEGGGWRADEYWTITDRGPNLGIEFRRDAAGADFGPHSKFFPAPRYVQAIYRLRVLPDDTARVTERIELTVAGLPVSGLPASVPERPSREVAFGSLETTNARLEPSPRGYDFEGIAEDVTADGGRRFWTCEEYGPSLQLFDGDGRLLHELIPGATPRGAGTADEPSVHPLPAVLRHRMHNRGFEGLALTRDAVWTIVQSPFDATGGISGEAGSGNAATRIHRLVRVDRETFDATQYAYEHRDDPETLGITHADMKVGDLAALDGEGSSFLVIEHAGSLSVRIYRADVIAETTVLLDAEGVAYEAGTRAYTPLRKTLVADLTAELAALETPSKLEGIVVAAPDRIVLSFDNDYGFESDEVEIFPLDPDASRAVLLEVLLAAPLE